MRAAISPFSLSLAAVSLLVTLVISTGIWDSFFPDPDAEGLQARREYYEKTLRQANVSWREGLYYRVMDGKTPGDKP